KSYYAQSLLATDDGGFLFVLGFSDYAIDQEKWASDGGFASRVIKCDKNGKPQFDTALENIEGHALRFAFQKNGKYYFFGTHEVPETKTRGVYSYTDVYAAVLDENGAPVNSTTVAGSDFDELIFAEKCEGGFLLSISSQSSNGDFKGSGSKGYDVSWKFTLDDDLRTVEKKKKAGRDYFDALIGFRSGEPVYRNDFAGFDAGYPTACVDYGDFYLIVSEHSTGEYENTPPYISSIWYYTETVYSAYDRNGDLIFRTAVDSTPDYDSLVESLSYPDQSIEQSE
ncbi:MAG: hypothetical protein J5793_00110, partial [Clostridia bacterium]|nr:hypothetical protein [Clostridia bacterium]